MSIAPVGDQGGSARPDLKIGLGIFTGQTPPGCGISVADEYGAILNMAVAAEELGFDSVWLSEHHGANDNYLPSTLPVAGAIAARTERIAIGTAILIPSFWHPVRLAEDVAVVDQLSKGRFILGLGLGWRSWEFKMFGVERTERVGRTSEMIQILRRLWSGDRVSHHGKYYQLNDALLRPTPIAGSVPIFLAGSKERPIRRAASIADGLIYSISGPTAAAVQPSLDHVLAALDASDDQRGRRGTPFPITLLLNVFVSENEPWSIIGQAVDYQSFAYATWKSEDAGTALGPNEAAAAATAWRGLIIAGPPSLLAERLQGWVRAIWPRRALHLVLKVHYPGVDYNRTLDAMKLIAIEICLN